MSRYRSLADRWDARLTRFREIVAHYTPNVLTFYPFEVLATVVGLLVGISLLLGVVAPTSLALLLPDIVYGAYAVGLTLGGLTTAVGLYSKNNLVLAPGLQLLGGSYLVYSLAVLAISGFATGGVAFGAFVLLGLLCLIRASHFRRLLDIQKGAIDLGRRIP